MIESQVLGDLVSELYSCESVTERFSKFEHYVQKLGFESASYTFVPDIILSNKLDTPPVFVCSSLFPESFIEQYAADRFDQHDFTIRAIRENVREPLDWQAFIKSDYTSAAEKRVISLAEKEHKIRRGITIPAMNEAVGIAGFSFVEISDDSHFDQLKTERLKTLHRCSKSFHDIAFSRTYAYHEFVPDTLLKITEKEKIVLEFIANGRTMRELGDSAEPVSRRYGEALLLKLRERFGGVTTHELIRYATQLRII